MRWRAPAAFAAGWALAIVACAGEEAARPSSVPPVTTAPAFWSAKNVDSARIDSGGDAGDAGSAGPLSSAVPPPPSRAVLPEPSFGSESAKPGDPHAFRLAMALRAMRGSSSGVKVLKLLSAIPAVIDAKRQTAVDPFADGEWLLVYGSAVAVPGPNANVVKHTRADADVSKTLADAGLEASDGGASGGLHAELFGVRDVLLRPQSGMLALVPGDRAREIAGALQKPIDPGVKPGELARIFVAEPAKLAPRLLPVDIVRGTVIVKAAPDGGLDASAEADCADAASCKTTATALDELVKRQNSILVRIVLKNVLASFTVRADRAMLRASIHAAPDQVDALLNILRAELGLPGDGSSSTVIPP